MTDRTKKEVFKQKIGDGFELTLRIRVTPMKNMLLEVHDGEAVLSEETCIQPVAEQKGWTPKSKRPKA